ncbi:MAG: Ig-like domain-containing protein, partial [Cyclobacteriaceae bacterium]|nr:Ig-like domain-containing protein [Cyclobacteriaceae bacterium HetDA_MAG_MS6]
MKKTITENLRAFWQVLGKSALWIFVCLAGNLATAADLREVLPVTDKILLLLFDEGHVDHATQENVNVNVFYNPLDVSSGGAYNLSRYTLTSPTDTDFASGLNPINVGRKSKPSDVVSKFTTPQALMDHSIYIELPQRLKQGNVYTLDVGSLADNLDEFTFVFDASKMRSASIHVNQVGFVPNRPKYAYISQFMGDFDNGQIENGRGEFPDYDGKRFDIIRVSDGASVFNGTVQFRKSHTTNDGNTIRFMPFPLPNEDRPQNYNYSDVLEIDFSGLTTPGEYKVVVKDMGSSYPFEINTNIFRDAFSLVLRSLFYQRQGIIQEIEPGREYPRDYHPDDIPESRFRYDKNWRWLEDPRHQHVSQPSDFEGTLPIWGWYHDAGDWDTYGEHVHVPISLNVIYMISPGNFGDGDVGNRYKLSNTSAWIDEGTNGIPDILDEARWLMEYYERGKNVGQSRGLTTGGVPGVYAGVDAGALDGFPSWQDNRDLRFTAEGPYATFAYAAMAAMYAENMDAIGRNADRDKWETEAINAWNWASTNQEPGDESLYGVNMKKMRHLAAVALYIRTKNTSYQTSFKTGMLDDNQYQSAEEGWGTPHWWEYGALLYTTLPSSFPGLDIAFQSDVKNVVLGMADSEYITPHDQRGMRVAFDTRKAHFLGMQSTPMLTSLINASLISSDQKYADAVHTSTAFFLGGNQEDMTWINGLGEKSQRFTFHPNSWFINDDYNSKVYSNEMLLGYVTYGSYQNPDFINGFEAGFTGDEDYAKTLLYPDYVYQNWPIMEQHIPNRYAIPGGEFTVSQNMAPASLTYGFLAGASPSSYEFNSRPTVSINVPSSIGAQGATISATTSADTRRVEYYYEEHFIGWSEDKANNFEFFWNPPLPAGTNNVLLTAVAYDDKGLISRPSSGGDQTVNIVSGGFTAVSSVSIDQGGSISLPNIGDEVQLSATISPSSATNKTVLWSSANVAIVTVDADGTLKATGNGITQVRVVSLDGARVDVIDVSVGTFEPVTGVTVSPTSLTLSLSRDGELSASVLPSNASNKNVTWSSLNPSIATVDANGVVTGVGIGSTQVRVTTEEGGFIENSTVTVTDLNCTSLLQNASFESGLTGWTLNEGVITTVSDAVDGSSSAQATGQAGMEQQFAQPLAEGTNVIVRFSAKVDSTNGFSGSGLDFKDAAGNTLAATNVTITSTAWQQYQIQADAPAGTQRLNVWFFTASDILNVDDYCMDIEDSTPPPPDTEAPSIPDGLNATSMTENSFVLNWNAASDNVGVSQYEVFRDGNSAGTTTTTSLAITGLSASTTYSMTVLARDAAGNASAQSTALSVTTASPSSSTTVTDRVSTTNDDAEETISTGAMNLTSNDLDIRSTDLNAMRFQLNVPQGATIESATIDFLAKDTNTGGNTLTFRAQASDNAAQFSTATGDISSRSTTTASVDWNPTDWTLGTTYTSSDLTSIIQEVVNRSGWTANNNIVIIVSASSANKRAARTFDFAGSSADAPELSVTYSSSTPGDTEAPSVPNGLSAASITENSFVLNWNASTDNVGVTLYEVFQNTISIGTTSTPSFNVTGLAASTTYDMTITARDAAGNISAASSALPVTTSGGGGSPNFLEAEDATFSGGVLTNHPSASGGSFVDGNAGFNISWSYSVASGGAHDLNFSVAAPGGTRTMGVFVNNSPVGTISTSAARYNWEIQSVTANLNPGSNTIELRDTEGASEPDVDYLEVVSSGGGGDTEAPTVPSGLAASDITDSSFTLSWSASTDNVGVTLYEVFQNGSPIGTTATTSLAVTGLSASTAYDMTVTARDAAGNISAASAAETVTTSAVPDTEAPSVPSGLASSAIGETSFTLSWNASTDNVGVVGYDVYRDSNLETSVTGTSASITGLSANTTHAMTVVAKDAASNFSAASSPLNVTTAAPSGGGVEIQAENFSTRSGTTTETGNSGFTGTGYEDYGGNGTFAEWTTNLS